MANNNIVHFMINNLSSVFDIIIRIIYNKIYNNKLIIVNLWLMPH